MGGVIFQVIAAGILHFNTLNFGLMCGLPSTTIMLFMSPNTVLNRPMTETEISLLGSLPSIGAIVGTPFFGFLLDKLGRKNSAIITCAIGVISWGMLVVSRQVEVVLTSSFISGISAAVFLVVPVYVGEFSEDSIRGTLTSAMVVFYGVGMMLSFLLGGYLEYKTLTYVCTSMAAIGCAMLTILKESPTCLMKKGLEEEAAKSMAFYRNDKPESKIVQQELDTIRRSLAPESERVSSEQERLTSNINEGPAENVSCWQFFWKSQSTKRAFLVAMTLMTCAIFQGMAIVQIYAKPLFSEAVPEEVMSATWCSVLLAAVTAVFGVVTAYLTDASGRRSLMINASLASGVVCVALGTQIHMHWGPHWLTAVFIYIFCATFTMGAGTVPYLLLAELFLPEVRSVISMIVMEWTWACSFVALFVFNPVVSAIGLGPIFYVFAGVCVFSAVFSYYFLPETKGLTVDKIQLLFIPKMNVMV